MPRTTRQQRSADDTMKEDKSYVVRDFDGDVVTRLHTLEQAISAASLLDGTYEEVTTRRQGHATLNSTRQPDRGETK